MLQTMYSILTVMDKTDITEFGEQMLVSYDEVNGAVNSEYFSGFERGQLLLVGMRDSVIEELGLVCVEHVFREVCVNTFMFEEFSQLPIDPNKLRVVKEKSHDSW